MMTTQQNGSASTTQWLQLSVQQFFEQCNWNGVPLDAPKPSDDGVRSRPSAGGTLDLTLSVGQFFNAFSWDGSPAIAAPVVLDEQPAEATDQSDDLTLDDFTGLFG
jgi:hypothetical protein